MSINIEDKIYLSKDKLSKKISLSTTTIYKLIKTDNFPKPIRAGSRSLWDYEEVIKWFENKKEK